VFIEVLAKIINLEKPKHFVVWNGGSIAFYIDLIKLKIV
jgi:hypothetical protein